MNCLQLQKAKSDGKGTVYVISRGLPADRIAKQMPRGHCLKLYPEKTEDQIKEVFRWNYFFYTVWFLFFHKIWFDMGLCFKQFHLNLQTQNKQCFKIWLHPTLDNFSLLNLSFAFNSIIYEEYVGCFFFIFSYFFLSLTSVVILSSPGGIIMIISTRQWTVDQDFFKAGIR